MRDWRGDLIAKIETLDKKRVKRRNLLRLQSLSEDSHHHSRCQLLLHNQHLIAISYYYLAQWGWIELDNSYRLIKDFMTPSCVKAGAMLAVWLMVLFGSNKQMLLQWNCQATLIMGPPAHGSPIHRESLHGNSDLSDAVNASLLLQFSLWRFESAGGSEQNTMRRKLKNAAAAKNAAETESKHFFLFLFKIQSIALQFIT